MPVPLARAGIEVSSTRRQDDVWQRIRDGFAMPDLAGPLVAEKTAWYVARREYLKRVFERSIEALR